MKTLKNISVGFLVSFIGSIPLGYLNIIGFDIYTKSGKGALTEYLLGVVIIEAVVIYGTLVFAEKLLQRQKLIRLIEAFSILFLLLVAFSFYAGAKNDASHQMLPTDCLAYAPFWAGIILSSLNFIQLPFWAGWNLYLVNAHYISVEKKQKFIYLAGTLAGTFSGMLALVLFLDLVTGKTDFLSKYLTSAVIPLFFAAMALYQAFKFYRKYYRKP